MTDHKGMNHKDTKTTRVLFFVPFMRLVVLMVLISVVLAQPVHAAGRFAVVVSGASAGAPYAEKYDGWRNAFVATLKQKFSYPDDHLFVLSESAAASGRSTRENVRAIFGGLRGRLNGDDLLLVVLIGHGTTGDRGEAKFNLVGPDLTASEWSDLLKPIAGRIVFVNTTGASFPFLPRLAAPGRVVITSTDSAAQQFETVFAGYFLKAFDAPAADADKNGRVSIWEAFEYASTLVRQWFEMQGQLATERPLLDDNGDGQGREAQGPGADGALARTLFVAPETPAAGDPEILRRRAALERQLDDLRTKKALTPNSTQFDAEIEKLLIEIAQLSRQLRGRTP